MIISDPPSALRGRNRKRTSGAIDKTKEEELLQALFRANGELIGDFHNLQRLGACSKF